MPHVRYTTQEIARRGQELYDREVRANVEPDHNGEFLVIDVETGEYELAATAVEGMDRIQERRPDAPLYIVRVGSQTAYKLGWRGGSPPA